MSRIARIPVVLASGVDCKITADSVTLKGKVGEVSTHILPLVEIKQDGNTLHFSAKDESRESNQNSGTMTALVRSMNTGVSVGFTKTLTLVGVCSNCTFMAWAIVPRLRVRSLTFLSASPTPSCMKCPKA